MKVLINYCGVVLFLSCEVIASRVVGMHRKGLFTPKTRVFSVAEILLRIYQNPIHLDGTRFGGSVKFADGKHRPPTCPM